MYHPHCKTGPALKLAFLIGDESWDWWTAQGLKALPENSSLFGLVPPEKKKKLGHTPTDSLISVLDALDTLQIKAVLLFLRKAFHIWLLIGNIAMEVKH